MKRFAAILLTGILSLSTAIPSFAAVNTNADLWAVSSMEYASEAGFVTDTELKNAKAPMSRQAFCGVIIRFLESVTGKEWKATQESPFKDCKDEMVIAAYEAGIIGGIGEGIFAPKETLTREQMAIIAGRALKVCGIDLTADAKKNTFTDTKELYASSNAYIDQLSGAKIINGYKDGTYGPFREMTVQEAVVSFVRAHRYATTGNADDPNAKDTADEPSAKGKTETVTVGGRDIMLDWTAAELKAVWGEPDRVDTSVYGLDRYIYINDYTDYFFATFEKGKIVEIFVPGTSFSYMDMNGTGTTADIKNLSYVSSVEHSGVIHNDASEVRVPLDYQGKICGLLLQTKAFATNKDPVSTLQYAMKEDVEAQLVDLIQVRRKEQGLSLLTVDKKLVDVARAHSDDMVSKNYFDYNSPDGTTPFGRIMARGKTFLTASEIIAKQRGDVVNVYQEWMRTAARHNGLMDSTMQEVGVGVASKSKTLYVTVDFCGQSTQNTKK